ncbi:unnamed protein product, partial [Onchocerca ochengi]|uniref:Transmembrane protein n=1 Tax=Onchocerca ochengi TaxID=42157 RepID=A0A182EBC3_ONCOC
MTGTNASYDQHSCDCDDLLQMISLLLPCLFLGIVANSLKFAEMISTRSTAAKDILLCGDIPATDVE